MPATGQPPVDWDAVFHESEALLERHLQAAGADGPEHSFASIWQAVVAWALEPPVTLAEGQVDELNIIGAWHEVPTEQGFPYMAPPDELALPLFGISIGRKVAEEIGPHSTTSHHVGGLEVYFEDTDVWMDGLSAGSYFLGRGANFPAVDYFSDALRLAELADQPLIQIALEQPPIGFSTDTRTRVWK